MKSFSNTYIFIFSAVMVIVVAAVLSFIALQLKPIQDRNVRIEQMQNILSAVNIESTTKNAQQLFDRYISQSYVVDVNGEVLADIQPIDVDMKKELARIEAVKLAKSGISDTKTSPFKKFLSGFISFKAVDAVSVNQNIKEIKEGRKLPVYIYNDGNVDFYIFPMMGRGLWGPVWGYVSLHDDFNTIFGANFDHKSETPGLGAEINEEWFEAQFIGKKIFEGDKFVSVKVLKSGTYTANDHAVDAISGGTITSKGLEAMIYDSFMDYMEFFKLKSVQDE